MSVLTCPVTQCNMTKDLRLPSNYCTGHNKPWYVSPVLYLLILRYNIVHRSIGNM